MNKALIAAALSTVALGIGAGCEPNTQEQQSTQPVDSVDSVSQNLCSTRDQVHPLDFVLARIGTTVLQCKGSFQYSDFFVDKEGFLQTTIERCEKDQSLVEDLKNLLQLQHVPESGAKNHFAGHWAAWNLRYSKNPVECPPRWDEAAQIDPPTRENAEASIKGCPIPPPQTPDVPTEPATCGSVPQKLKMDWRITPPKDCENNMSCAHERARLCSDWFGATFHVGSNLQEGYPKDRPELVDFEHALRAWHQSVRSRFRIPAPDGHERSSTRRNVGSDQSRQRVLHDVHRGLDRDHVVPEAGRGGLRWRLEVRHPMPVSSAS